MKLHKLRIFGYKNLDSIEINFEKSLGQTLIVGTNGSGKSNLLEAISAIFSALYNHDSNIFPDFRFELEYVIGNPPSIVGGRRVVGSVVSIRVRNVDGIIEVSYCDSEGDEYHIVSSDGYDGLLPDHVIAVYSGEEQRLWEDYYFKA